MEIEKFIFTSRFIPFYEVRTLLPESVNLKKTANVQTFLTPTVTHTTFPAPRFWFHPPGKIGSSRWTDIRGPGIGIANTGNSCFVNAALQALFYCPPLSQHFLRKLHSKSCQRQLDNLECVCCVFEQFLNEIFRVNQENGALCFLKPPAVLRNLVGKGRCASHQQDTHEALTVLLEKLRRSELPASLERDFDRYAIPAAEMSTSFLNQILVGFMLESMICLECNTASRKFLPFWDIIASIENCSTFEEALEKYFQDEHLKSGNEVMCGKCGKKQRTKITRAVYRSPNILTVVFQRVARCVSGGIKKLRKDISIPLSFDLSPFWCMLRPQNLNNNVNENPALYDNGDCKYNFCSAIVHSGSAGFGHYFTYCRAPNNQIYCIDDELVRPVNIVKNNRLELPCTSVYVCMFVRTNPTPSPSVHDVTLFSDIIKDNNEIANGSKNGLNISEALAKAANRKFGESSDGISAQIVVKTLKDFDETMNRESYDYVDDKLSTNSTGCPDSPSTNSESSVLESPNGIRCCSSTETKVVDNGVIDIHSKVVIDQTDAASTIKAQKRNKRATSIKSQFTNTRVDVWKMDDSEVTESNCTNANDHTVNEYVEAQKELMPNLMKRAFHDREYDKGKLKKGLRKVVISKTQKYRRMLMHTWTSGRDLFNRMALKRKHGVKKLHRKFQLKTGKHRIAAHFGAGGKKWES